MGGYTFLFGNIIFYITLVNDILYGMGVIHTIHMSMYGFLLFIFSQSIILSTKFSRSFTLSENLADELTEKSNNLEIVNNELLDLQKGLEEKVEERGKQIEEIYNKNLLEVQKVNILEKELAVQKERQKIFTDIHDHMGSNILDLSKILNSFSSNVNGDKDNLEKAKLSLSKIEDNLRMKMYSIEDLEIFRKDPINGIRLLIQRRYSIYKREIYFYCDSSLLEMPPEYFSRHKMETLFSISQENANNDLKYGKGESEWNFFPDRDYLCLEIKSETTYDFHSSEIGNGKKNIHLRLKELNGYCFQCLEEGKFHARYFVPLV
ncbi:MAG: hypothetical protein KDK36_17095 [Leptospiraceae bacterium]|nr:hypothetical protein [Leptospiraceae bacterium]